MLMLSQRKTGDEAFWPKLVLKKWLDLDLRSNKDSKFKQEQNCGCGGGDDGASVEIAGDDESKLRRRNSATMRAQFINTKELRICIGTYNVAGKAPPEGLDIAEWLGTGHKEADTYVLGFQEVVPLNAGIVIGGEDGQTALAWEELIRDMLTRISTPSRPKYRCRSSPATPTRDGADELFPGGTDTETDDDAPFSFPVQAKEDLEGEQQPGTQQRSLLKTMSTTDRIGLVWPEQPLDLLAMTTASSSVKSSSSFSAPSADDDNVPDLDLDLDGALARGGKKKGGRLPFVRIVSKQMVGIFLAIWVRRGLRRCVQNLKVSTVGVGNKGAVSVSMSVCQTMFCFVCSHLALGERPANLLKRNADVQEILRRTHFVGPGGLELPRDIYDHERIFWLGDLNYRIDVPYDRAHSLVAAMDWSQLAEKDQLKRELRKGRAFDGWSEGALEFAPTYKYEIGSGKYISDDQRGGRRTPAWCDRVLSFGKGVRLVSYGRSELALSDHMPVAATYVACCCQWWQKDHGER